MSRRSVCADQLGKLFVGDVGLRLHHARQAEKQKPERFGNQADLDGAIRGVFGHDVILDAGYDLADGLRGEPVAQAQLFQHGEHGARLARRGVERASERRHAVLQFGGHVAEDAQFVPGRYAFQHVFEIVVEHGVGDGLLVGEVVVHEAACYARLARDGGHARGGHPFGFVQLARGQHDVAGRSVQPRAAPDLPRNGMRQVRIEFRHGCAFPGTHDGSFARP